MAKPALKWSHSPGSRHFQSDGFGEVPRRIEGQQGGGNDCPHVCPREAKLFADRTIGNRKIIPAHVKRRVEQADEASV